MRKKVRTLRHWKQRFDKNAEFIWRRPVTWQGEAVTAGDPIPEDLQKNKLKLRRFWEAKVIELAEFDDPDVVTGQKPERVSSDTADENTPLGPSEPIDFVGIHDEQVPIDEILELAIWDSGCNISEWNSLTQLDRDERMQDVVEMMLDQGDEDEAPAEALVLTDKEPGDLVTKETDRKWHVEGVKEVFKSKTLATAKATEMLAEAKAAESSEDDAWLNGDNQED